MSTKIADAIDVDNAKAIDRFMSYVESNSIALFAIVGSLVGGLVLLFYFGHVSYFPADISMSNVGLLLAAAAMTGMFITILLALYFIIPGFVYRHIFDEKFMDHKHDWMGNRELLFLLDFPFIIAIVFVIIVFIAQLNDHFIFLLLAILFPLCVQLGGFPNQDEKGSLREQFVDWPSRIKFPSFKYERLWDFIKGVIGAFFVGAIALIPWIFASLLAVKYEQDVGKESDVWIVFSLIALVIIAANHIVASAKKWWFPFVVAPASLFLMLVISGQISLIPQMVVRLLALGNIPNVTLLLDEQGCQIASQYALLAQVDDAKTIAVHTSTKVSSMDLKKEANQKTTVCSLSSVNLLWRIGNEYFIDANQAQLRLPLVDKKESDSSKNFKNKPKHQDNAILVPKNNAVAAGGGKATYQLQMLKSKFTIPSAHVLSWTVVDIKKTVAP